MALAASAIVVRALGPRGYGVLSLVRTVLMVVVLLSTTGVGQTVLRLMPDVRVARDAAAARVLARRAALLAGAVWIVATAVAVAARGGADRAFHVDGVGGLIALAVSLAVFEAAFSVLSPFLYAAYDARRQSIAAVAGHAAYLAALIVVAWMGATVARVVAATALGFVVATALALPGLARAMRPGEDAASDAAGTARDRGVETGADGVGAVPRPEPAAPARRADVGWARILRYAAPMTAVALLNFVVWRQSETVLIAHFRTPEETGRFDIAYRLPQMALDFVPTTVWPLVMAGMAEVYARERSALAAAVRRYYRVLFAVSAPVAALGVALVEPMIRVVFGAAMVPAAADARAFFGVFFLSFFAAPLSMTLLVLERPATNLAVYAVLAAVNLGLDLWLIPRLGVRGAVLAVGAAIAISPWLYAAALRREGVAVSPPWARMVRAGVAAAPVAAAWPLLAGIGDVAGLAMAALGATLAMGVLYRGARVIAPEDRRLLDGIPLAGRLVRIVCP